MKRVGVLLTRSLCLFTVVVGCGGDEAADDKAAYQQESSELVSLLRVPGLVMGLQHNQNQTSPGTVMFWELSGVISASAVRLRPPNFRSSKSSDEPPL